MQTIVIYPGTFDPITKGHIDLVRRSLRIFDSLIVAVAENPKKQPAFTCSERVALASLSFKGYSNVKVCPFSGLLVDFAKQHQAQAILRGLRAISDFDYEFQLAGTNRKLCAQIETIFLMPSEQYAFISSSMVRELAELGGDVSSFVEKNVASALKDLFKRR